MSAHNDIATTEALSAYLDDELSADERTDLEKHLEKSPESRHRLEALRRVVDGLHRLESAPPPPTLERFVTREIAFERERVHWLQRMEGSFSILGNRQSPIFLFFALIVAISIFVYFFAVAVQKGERGSPTLVHTPGDRHVVGERLEVAGRQLFWGEDDAWYERGADGPARVIELGTHDGRVWLDAHPELAPVAELGEPAVVVVEGEVVRLVPAGAPPAR